MGVIRHDEPGKRDLDPWPSRQFMTDQKFGQLMTSTAQDWTRAPLFAGYESNRRTEPEGFKKLPGPDISKLVRWLAQEVVDEVFEKADTILVLSENRPLDLESMDYLPATLTRILERTTLTRTEKWHAIHIPLDEETGLGGVHYTWGAVFAIEALTVRFPAKHFVLWDYDAAPTALYEIKDIVRMATVAASIAHPEWEPSRVRPGIAVISERVSAVNAGIVFFIGEGDLASETPTNEQWTRDILEGRTLLYNKVASNEPPWAKLISTTDLDQFVRTQTDTCASTQTWEAVARRQTGDPHLFGAKANKTAQFAHMGLIRADLQPLGPWHGACQAKAKSLHTWTIGRSS